MNKDEVKGKAKEVGGRIQRQAGEWTGDTGQQAEGTKNEVAGKTQQAWGNVKEKTEKAVDEMKKDDSKKDDETAA